MWQEKKAEYQLFVIVHVRNNGSLTRMAAVSVTEVKCGVWACLLLSRELGQWGAESEGGMRPTPGESPLLFIA